MAVLLLSAAALVVQLFLFLCVGSIVMKIRGRQVYSLSQAALMGYFVWFGLFEVICLICEISLLPLRTLSLIMVAAAGAAILLGLFAGYRSWIEAMNSLRYRLSLHGTTFLFLMLALAASVAFVILYSDASADSGWYVGEASTALATNTIGRFDPSTGTQTLRFQARYALNCFPYHNAVICSLLRGLPVIVQARSVMSAINMIMSFLAVYALGLSLFPDEEEKSAKIRSIRNRPGSYSRRRADLFVMMVFVINLLSSTIYMPGIFLYMRTYEGKALIVNVVIPAVLAVGVRMWHEMEEDSMRNLFWMMAAAVCFSASSIMALLLSLMIVLPLIAVRGKWNRLIPLIGACSPVLAWGGVYYLIQHGMIVLRTWR